jgi:hypothetical protein
MGGSVVISYINAPRKLVILEGSAHAQFIFQTVRGERRMQEILRFLSAPLAGPRTGPRSNPWED